MRLGILSDTHDEAAMMRHAINALRDRGAAYVIHCGDLGSPAMLDLFQVLPGRHGAGFIFGNDGDEKRDALRRRAKELGVHCFESFGEFEMAGKKFAVVHGDDQHRVNQLVKAREHDFVLHGHKHVWRDESFGEGTGRVVRVINPGSLYKPKSDADGLKARSCALLDINSGRLVKIWFGCSKDE